MEKEWGGYLPIELPKRSEYFLNVKEEDIVRLDCGRSTFWYALNDCKPQKLYVPYLNCINSTDPADDLGVPYEFYRLSNDLLPIDIDPSQDEAVLWVNYYGNSSPLKVENLIKRYKNTNLIIDNCQAFFTKIFPQVYNCYSTRKFFGVCDGAYLIKDGISKIDLPKSESSDAMLFLLKTLERGTNACYRENLQNENRLGKQPYLMSALTRRILSSIDYGEIKRIRNENFNRLHERLCSYNQFNVDISSATHMYYPFLTDRIMLREKLIEKKIYTPTWWRHVPELLDNDEHIIEVKLAKYMLMLPIDQRYDTSDMEELADIVLREYMDC